MKNNLFRGNKETRTSATGIEYEWPFETEKFDQKVWEARTNTRFKTFKPLVRMSGTSEQEAIDKLLNFLNS